MSGTLIEGCLPAIAEQAAPDGSVNECLIWTFWLALPSGNDVPIFVESPATGSLQGAGITASDANAVQNEKNLSQALSDLLNGIQVTTTVVLTGPQVYCGYSYTNDVLSVALSEPLKAALAHVLEPSGKQATRRAIVKASGYTFTFSPPSRGNLVIHWTATVHRKKALIASANSTLSGTPNENVKIRLTKVGKMLLKAHQIAKIESTATFVPANGVAKTRTATFVLKS